MVLLYFQLAKFQKKKKAKRRSREEQSDDHADIQNIGVSGGASPIQLEVRYFRHLYDLHSDIRKKSGTVARSDARPPGMQAVAGSILTSGNILSWS